MQMLWFKKIERLISNVVSRGSLSAPIDDSEDVQTASYSTFPGQDYSGDLRAQNYGFTSRPSTEAEIVLLRIDGSQDSSIVISADHPAMRPKIKEYESCVWTKFGTHVWLKDDSSIDVKCVKLTIPATESVVLQTPKFAVKSDSGELINAIYQALLGLQQDLQTVGAITSPITGSPFTAPAAKLLTNIQKIQPFIVS